MRCKNCGLELSDNAIVCIACGTTISQNPQNKKITICKNCGFELSDNAIVCIACGTTISQSPQNKKIIICKSCGFELSDNATICIACGISTGDKKETNNIKTFLIEFIKLASTITALFGISLAIAIIIGENSDRPYDDAICIPFYLSSIILFILFVKNTLNFKKIWRVFMLLSSIVGIVSSTVLTYEINESAERYEAIVRERRIEAAEREKVEAKKRKELKITASQLKNKIYLSNQGLNYNTGSWKEEDTVYYSHEGSLTFRNVIKGDTHFEVYGVTIKGRISNQLKHRNVKVEVKIKARGEIEKNCALLGCNKWGGKKINDSFTMNVPPGGITFSKYYDLVTKMWSVGIGITGGESKGTYLESKPDIKVKIID